MTLYFRDFSDNAETKEYYDGIKHRALLMLDEIVNEKDNTDEIENITTNLITFFKPLIFGGSESVEINHDKNFNDMCLVLSMEMNIKPKEMTVLEFYNAVEALKKMRKAANNGK